MNFKSAKLILHTTLYTALLSATLICSSATPGVFQMPQLHDRHIQLITVMDEAHGRNDFITMESICRTGINLGSDPPLWHYNLACALALQGQEDEALQALDQAISHGFIDYQHTLDDSDFTKLRQSEAFQSLLTKMKRNATERENHMLPVAAPALPDAGWNITQSTSNTWWSFQLRYFQTLTSTNSTSAPQLRYQGPESSQINTWLSKGSATGSHGIIYANRDNNTHPFDTSIFPGLLRLNYSPEAIERKLHIGTPNTLFVAAEDLHIIPTIGHSAMGYLDSSYWRSQPRALFDDPTQVLLHASLFLGSQLFFYPTFNDYSLGQGDLFPANTPYCIPVAGIAHSEQPFVKAAIAAISAMSPQTRHALAQSPALMPTLQMLFRLSQPHIKTPADYLTGTAHPPALLPESLNTPRLVELAHHLTPETIPPWIMLRVISETHPINGKDFFDGHHNEVLFNSPMAIARVFRGTQQQRTIKLQAECSDPQAPLHWVILQGDPSKISIIPDPSDPTHATITVSYHERFNTPIANQQQIMSSRVDIGIFAQGSSYYSCPTFLTFYFLPNERRIYRPDGQIESVDYTRHAANYTDPLISMTRGWKDTYTYDTNNNCTGWIRKRRLHEERFTPYGHKVVTTDHLGRPATAHLVRYMARHIRQEEDGNSIPDLAQIDDNLELTYIYASDSDTIGKPDLTGITQQLAPPD